MRNLPAARIRQALGAITVVAVVLAWSGVAAGAEMVGELVSASGPVEVRPLGQAIWRVASQRIVLHPGDMVRTGPGGSAEIALVTAVVRMDENTVLVLPPPQAMPASAGSTSVHLLLQGGRALFRVFKDRLQGTFEVITPSIIVGVKGTTFGVEQGPNLGVVVFEGIVQVAQTGRPDLPPIDVRGGQYTVLTRGGLSAPRPYEPARPGPVWNQAPTSTMSNALPVGAGRGSAPGSPVATPSQGATAPVGTAPAPAPASVLSSPATGDVPSLSVNGPAEFSSGGATGVNATTTTTTTATTTTTITTTAAGLTGSDPPGLNGAGTAASSGGGSSSGGTSGGGPPGLSGNGSPGPNGGGQGGSDDGGRGHGRGGGPPGLTAGGPPGLRGGGPPGLAKFGGIPPGQGGGKK